MVAENICVAFLGFDSDRIYLPFEAYHCSKLYIIKRKSRDHQNAEYNYGLIKKRIKKENILEQIVEMDIFLRINCLKNIFEAEKENRIYLNVSTGSKLDAIAGMLAVMLFNKIPKEVIAFYAHPTGSGRMEKHKFFSETTGLSRIEEVPILDIQKPENGLLEALRILSETGAPLKKQKLVETLCARNHIEGYQYLDGCGIVKSDIVEELKHLDKNKRKKHARELRNSTSGALHVTDNRILRLLKTRWKAIDEEDRPRNKKISLTDNGKMLVRIFFGDLIKKT